MEFWVVMSTLRGFEIYLASSGVALLSWKSIEMEFWVDSLVSLLHSLILSWKEFWADGLISLLCDSTCRGLLPLMPVAETSDFGLCL